MNKAESKLIYSQTMALCPKCMSKVRARIIEVDSKVFLEKFCPEHGFSRVLISSDPEWYRASMAYIKPSQNPKERNVEKFVGCPQSCGLCPEHRQHVCLPIIEITDRCDLSCPVCLKKFDRAFSLSVDQFAGIIDNLMRTEGRMDVVNISGGEPLLHPDLEQMIRLAREKGVSQVSVSTNGLAFLDNPALRQMFRETRSIAALQFDGFKPETWKFIRGVDLAAKKQEIIRVLEAEGITYSLVSTILKGVNDDEIAAIRDFFFASQAVSLMFQPVTFSGSAASLDAERHRLTIPDVVQAIEGGRHVKKGDFNPLPCSHYSCFALSYYLKVEDGDYYSLKEFLGRDDYLAMIANKTLPGLDSNGYDMMKNRLYKLWSAADSSTASTKLLNRVKAILKKLNQDSSTDARINAGIENMKAIFIHHFMDVHTLDFGRLIKCCNPYPMPGDRLVPMCAQNVFGSYQESGKKS
ncbi:MAG: radical SAM protein [Candidatus Riflebacteria bacterium]|nr:radical SAM protein [Candidatus Riflebacteria bacterium]